MSRGRGLVLVLGLVACGVLAWSVVSATESSRDRRSEAAAELSGSQGAGRSAEVRSLGVGARPADPARSRLSGRIEDTDGTPYAEGRVRLSCLSGGPEQIVPVEADGSFHGSACDQACASFIHPSMIQTEAWVLRAGREEVWSVRPLARHGGVVTSPEGEPVAAARLHLDRPGDGPSAEPLGLTSANTVSDGDGRFSFAVAEPPPCDPCRAAKGRCVAGEASAPLSATTFELSAAAPGYRGVRRQVSTASEEPWTVVLAAPGEITQGRLVDEEGRAYPRAKILARSTERPSEVHRAALEGAEFELGELGEGTYELRAIQDGVELALAEGIVAGEAIELVGGLPASGVELRVQIVDRGGRALPGVLVDGGPFVGAESDERGEVEAAQVLPGAYGLRLRPPESGVVRHRLMVREGESAWTERIQLEAQTP